MTDSPPLFEEMLAAYPADKREFARRVYDRFANGDATEFFAQLFLLLDVYANYAKRIPQAVSETNQSTLASLKKVREEIGLLAQTVETRSVNLDNLCEETTALCLATQEKCEAAAERLAKLTKEIGQQVDTKAIVESIRQSVDAGVRAEVITAVHAADGGIKRRRAADVGKNQERERGSRAGLAGPHLENGADMRTGFGAGRGDCRDRRGVFQNQNVITTGRWPNKSRQPKRRWRRIRPRFGNWPWRMCRSGSCGYPTPTLCRVVTRWLSKAFTPPKNERTKTERRE